MTVATDLSALPDSAITDPSALAALSQDRSGTVGAVPLAAVRARSVEEVQATLRWANSAGVPVVPRGGGSGVAGGATATNGSVVVDLTALNQITSIDTHNQIAEVQAGVLTADLDRAAREHGLFYAPDPASAEISTIGGNIATNAGGMRCVKYGVTEDSVLGLGVVLADGTLLRTGHRTAKGVTGYDLTSLLVGSEGTLGVVVSATVRLRPAPEQTATLAATFDSVELAAQACSDVLAARWQPSVLELLDQSTLTVIDRAQGTDLSTRGNALVIAQSDGSDAETQIAGIAAALQPLSRWIEHTTDPDIAVELLAARRLALPSIEAFGAALIEDICVPRSRLADAVRGIEVISARTGVKIYTFAHAGDGNLHPIIAVDSPDLVDSAAVHGAAGQVFELALELGGTLTGEHGVGVLKRAWVEAELGSDNVRLHHAIKTAFDPKHILNPGKAF